MSDEEEVDQGSAFMMDVVELRERERGGRWKSGWLVRFS